MTADTARPDVVGHSAIPDRWTANRSAIEATLAALTNLPDTSHPDPTSEPDATALAPAQTRAEREVAPLPTRRSLREAAVQQRPDHARARAGLFSRMLTVRAFRTRNTEAGRDNRCDGVVAQLLAAASVHGVVALRHRRVPGQRGAIEHLAVGPSGVFVIDAKHAKKASVESRQREGASDLLVGGQDMTTAVTATARRVEAVRSVLAGAGLQDLTVTGTLCVIDGLLPLGVTDLEVRGVHVVQPNTLTSLVSSPGRLDPNHRSTLQEFLAERLPTASARPRPSS